MPFWPFSQPPLQPLGTSLLTWTKRLFPVLVVVGFLLRLVAAVVNRGYYHPDEFFNYLEPAFQWVFPDYKNRFDTSLDTSYRSYLIIGLHYLVLKILRSYALFTPTSAAAILKVCLACLSMGIVYATHKISAVYHSREFAKIVSLFMLFWYYFIFFAPHFLSENYTCLFSILAFYYLARFERLPATSSSDDQARAGKRLLFAFGFWLAIASQFRLQSAFFVLFPFAYALYKRQFGLMVALGSGFWLPTILFGLGEYFYKGSVFATMVAYYQINIGNQGLILANASPWYQYLLSYNFQFAEWFFPIFIYFMVRGFWHAMPLAGGSGLVYFLIHCIFPHKEVRFLFPLTPLLIVAACIGFKDWWDHTKLTPRLKGRLAGFFAVSLLAAELFHINHSQWRGNISGDVCTLLEQAGGLARAQHVVLVERGYHCGYFSLARDIPLSRIEPSGAALTVALQAVDWQAFPEHLVLVEEDKLGYLQEALHNLPYSISSPLYRSGAMALLEVRAF